MQRIETSYIKLYTENINGNNLTVTKMLNNDQLFIYIITYYSVMKYIMIEKVFNNDNEAIETAKKIMELL